MTAKAHTAHGRRCSAAYCLHAGDKKRCVSPGKKLIELKRLNSLERRNTLSTGRGQEKSAFQEIISYGFFKSFAKENSANSLFLFYNTE